MTGPITAEDWLLSRDVWMRLDHPSRLEAAQAAADILNAALAPRAPDSDALREAWPDELTPALSDILGTMCFECIHLAQAFRAVGFKIPNKAEAEQAFVLHRMLTHWLKVGDDWRASAQAELTELRAALAPAASGSA